MASKRILQLISITCHYMQLIAIEPSNEIWQLTQLFIWDFKNVIFCLFCNEFFFQLIKNYSIPDSW